MQFVMPLVDRFSCRYRDSIILRKVLIENEELLPMLSEKYSADNPAYNVRPGLKFAFSHPAHAVALFFGAGCLRPGPGTWGTLAGVLVWTVLVQFLSWKTLSVCIAVLFVLGALAAEKTCRDLGVQDAGCVVVDEVVAVWLVCLMLPQNGMAWCAAFLAFRLFDIVKLPPASWVDRHIHNGWGIMLDDLLAGVWAAVVLVGIDMLCNRLFPGANLFLGVF